MSKYERTAPKRKFQNPTEDRGSFIYNDLGFWLRSGMENLREFKWAEIESIFGYKVDLITTDEICLDIFTSNNLCLTLAETLPEWDQFNGRLRRNIGLVSDNWISEISIPVFETKLTLLFDRKCRNFSEVRRECYEEVKN